MENFHKTLLDWRISTTTGFVGKFLQIVLLKTFQKTLFRKVTPIICFVGKFPQKFAALQISTNMSLWKIFHNKVPFIENFHKTLLGWRISTTTDFVGKYTPKVALLEHFHKTLFC